MKDKNILIIIISFGVITSVLTLIGFQVVIPSLGFNIYSLAIASTISIGVIASTIIPLILLLKERKAEKDFKGLGERKNDI